MKNNVPAETGIKNIVSRTLWRVLFVVPYLMTLTLYKIINRECRVLREDREFSPVRCRFTQSWH